VPDHLERAFEAVADKETSLILRFLRSVSTPSQSFRAFTAGVIPRAEDVLLAGQG